MSFVALNHFNTIFNATISHRSQNWQNPQHTHDHQTRTASCDRGFSHKWSQVLLRVVYGLILMKILRDMQVHLRISEGRTLPVITHVGCWTCTTSPRFPCEILKRTLHLCFIKRTRKMSYDWNCLNDVSRSHLSLPLYARWLQVLCAHHKHINWTHSKRTSHLRHSYTKCSWFVRIVLTVDIFF